MVALGRLAATRLRFMAEQAGRRIAGIDAAPAVPVSQPRAAAAS